jgi:lipopolysaccharide/colanic/teichoic acid biosynthesis glycosyltransferase
MSTTSYSYSAFKRIIDFTLSLLFFACTIPLFIILSILIYFSLHENPIFLQSRHGYRCKTFTIIKLKTMRSLVAGENIDDHLRVTRFTSYIRQLRLDELPQLLCIVVGNMSFIGPRPLPVEYTSISKNPCYQRRYDVKPGILGLSQLYGGERLPFNHRLKIDLIYINNRSLFMDIAILFRTFILFFAKLIKAPSSQVLSLPLPKFD